MRRREPPPHRAFQSLPSSLRPPCSYVELLASQPIALESNNLDHKEIENSGQVSRYYTPEGSHMIKRSNYGAQGNLVEMRPLKEARVMSTGGMLIPLLTPR